jgi:hypothetical protein
LLSWNLAGEPGLEVEVAPGLDHLQVSTANLASTRSLSLWDASVTGYAGWRWEVGHHIYLRGGLAVGLRGRDEGLTVVGIGQILDLPPVWVSARLGLGFGAG